MAASQSKERIAKVLARAGVASRREVERMIAAGRITLHGKPVTTPVTLVASAKGITVDGKPVTEAGETRLWLYYKPKGLVTSHRDPQGRATVFDHLPQDMPRIVSAGRLDITTEGLLLLTNDGGLARKLEHPSSGLKRTYRVRAHGQVDEETLKSLSKGVSIKGIRYGPIEAAVERLQGSNVWLKVSLREGKNREVKNIMAYLGLAVTRLIRTGFGPFVLSDLNPEEVREISPRRVRQLMRKLK